MPIARHVVRVIVVMLGLIAALGIAGCGSGKQPTARLQFYPPAVSPAIGLSDTVWNTTANTFTVSWLVFNADPSGAVAYNVPWAVTRDGVPNVFTGTITAVPNHGWAPASFTVTEPVGVHLYQILIDPNGTIPQSSRDGAVITLWVTVFPAGTG
jgi:hypothetical protein